MKLREKLVKTLKINKLLISLENRGNFKIAKMKIRLRIFWVENAERREGVENWLQLEKIR